MKSLMVSKKATWISFLLAGLVYGCMLLITLPTISVFASGLAPFDVRPTGYSFEEATFFLTALSNPGRRYYLFYQLSLDVFYPALLAIALIGFLSGLAKNSGKKWGSVLMATSYLCVVGAVFDYLENLFIVRMLTSPELSRLLVQTASWVTVTKSLVTVVVLTVLLIGICYHYANVLVRWVSTKRKLSS